VIPLGLSHADRWRYETALTGTHRIRVEARIHDRNEKVISTISSRILGGAVDVNMASDPHRTLSLTILDPRHTPAWLPDGPSDFHVFANNFVSVRYGVWVEDLSDGPGWVDVPVFWGPITGLSQDGNEVNLTAGGKEILGLDPHLLWNTMELHKGRRRIAAIRDVLEEIGETRFDLPDLGAKLGKPLSLNRHAQVWRVAKAIAGGEDWQLYYDGRGRARVRKWPQNRVYTWRAGDGGTLLSKPNVAYDISAVRNLVEVLGPEPKGPPKRIRAVARARAKHNLSAESLKRNGQPRYLIHVVDSNLAKPETEWHKTAGGNEPGGPPTHGGWWGAPSGVKHPKRWFDWRHTIIVHRKKKAQQIADRQLANRLRGAVEVSYESLPIPHVEEGDSCAVIVDGMHIEFVLKQFTIPLTADAPMSVGVNRRPDRRQRKRTHQRRGHRR
jgi:YD repeat-containing protein